MKKAFTLLEMLLVLAIISLLVYVGTAGMIRFRENAEAEQATQQILSILSETQTKAKNNTIPYSHRFLPSVKNRTYAMLITRVSVAAVAENNQYLALEAEKAKVMGEDTTAMQYYINDPIYVQPNPIDPVEENIYVTGPVYMTIPAATNAYIGPAITYAPYITLPPPAPVRYILQRRICWKDISNPDWSTVDFSSPANCIIPPEDITSRYANISVVTGTYHSRPDCSAYFTNANEGILFENLTGKVISSVNNSVVNCQLALKMLSQDVTYSYIDFATGNFKRAY